MSSNNPYKTIVVKEALSILDAEEEEVFVLRHAHGVGLQEISRNLGYKDNWVFAARILERAEKKIAEHLEK